MVSDNDTAVVRETMATPVAQRRAMTAGRLGHTLPGDRPAAMSLASKRERLERLGLPPGSGNALSRAHEHLPLLHYAEKCSAFQRRCVERISDPSIVPSVMCSLSSSC